MTHSKTDILVVGGGPVGLASAIACARAGFKVRVIDKNECCAKESRAIGIHARTMEVFHNLGIVDKFFAEAFHVQEFNFYNDGKCVSQISLDQLDTPYAAIFMLPQVRTESILRESLLNTYGIRIERSTELMDFEDSNDKVTVKIQKLDDDEETIVVKYLIGCDGAHSTTRKKLGLQFEGLSMDKQWFFMDAEVETDLPSCRGFNMIWKGGSTVLFIPIGNNVYRILIDSDSSYVPDTDLTLDTFIKTATRLFSPFTFDVKNVIWFTKFQLNERKVKDYSQGRVFLCGDAAHIHSPAGGQGMNTGIQDAYNLAWKLSLVEHNNGNFSTLMPSYTAEREPIAAGVLALSGTILRAFVSNLSLMSSIRGQLVYALSSIPFLRAKMAQRLVGLSVEYPHSALTISHHGWIIQGPTSIKAGGRVPNIELSGLSIKQLHDFFSKPTSFHLVVWAPLNSASKNVTYLKSLKSSVTRLRNTFDGTTPFIEVQILSDETNESNQESIIAVKEIFELKDIAYVSFEEVERKFGFTRSDPIVLIIRPDGYLGLAVYLQNVWQIEKYFKRFMNH